MDRGVAVELLTSFRLMISGLVLLGIVAVRMPASLKAVFSDKKALVSIVVFALFGLVLNQTAYLQAIAHTNAGTATVLQYLCPILVLAFTCFKDRQLPTGVEIVSMILAIGGTFLIATHGQLTELAVTPIGLFWGIFSAITYSLYIILPTQVIKEYGSLVIIGLGMMIGGSLVTLGLQTWTCDFPLDSGSFLGLVGIVGVGTIFAYTAFLKGVSMVGVVNGSLLASIEPIASVVFAILLVNEWFYLIDLVGMVLILAGVLLISLKDLLIKKRE